MADNQNLINNLIGGLEFKDSRLASLLQTLANDLYGLNRQINPPVARSRNLNIGSGVTVIAPTGFSVEIFTNDIRLSWVVPNVGIFLYEIKLGFEYETANILLTTATHSADIDPVSRFILVGQTYIFWLTAVDSFGNRAEPLSLEITIPNIGPPILTNTVVGNNILLSWTVPTSVFEISHYIVYRFEVPIGTLNGTFDVIFEPSAGNYRYFVQAVDIVGNIGPLSGALDILLGNPADFLLYSEFKSTYSGTKTNVALDLDGALLCTTDGTISWEDHFISHGWSSITDQLVAGYGYYFQPAFTSGSYEELYDIGTIFAAIIVNITYTFRTVTGFVTIQSFISTSEDGITFTPYVPGPSAFYELVRYVRFKLEFSSSDDKSAIKIENLKVLLNVRTENDGGRVLALSTDVSGTRVLFNKTFQAIQSITLSPESNSTIFTAYDNADPTGFNIYAFTASGVRASCFVSWAGRGVV